MWTRRALLSSVAALTAARARGATLRPRLVLVIVDGGWDTTFCLDPKIGIDGIEGPDAHVLPSDPVGTESVETYAGIDIATNVARRPNVDAFFSSWASRCAVVRGLWTGSLAHVPAMERMITGAAGDEPDLTVRVGAAGTTPLGAVDLGGFTRPGRHGTRLTRLGANGQFGGLVDPAALPPATGPTRSSWVPGADDDAAIEAWLDARRGGLATGVASWDPEVRDATGRADQRMRALAGWDPDALSSRSLGDDAAVVAGLFGTGLADAALLSSRSVWDTHADNWRQHDSHDALFQGLDALAGTFESAGLLDDVVVAVVSELARTPWRNVDAGKDHWPWTSALLFGGPIRGGRVIGGTDDSMAGQTVDGALVTYDRLAAGLVAAVGLDPASVFPGSAPLNLL
jgi:hypothetical protein